MSQISFHDLAGVYTVEGLPGKKFKTRAAAEKAYTNMIGRQARDRTVVISFTVKGDVRIKLGEMAEEKNMTISALVREIAEKEVSNYEKRMDGKHGKQTDCY